MSYEVHRRRRRADTSSQELQKGLSKWREKSRNIYYGFGLQINGTRVENRPPLMGGHNKQDMETIVKQQKATVRQVLADVYEEINWAYLAKNYFGKSRSWLYHKFSGLNNGIADDFNDVDRERLRNSLHDIAGRIMQAADRL